MRKYAWMVCVVVAVASGCHRKSTESPDTLRSAATLADAAPSTGPSSRLDAGIVPVADAAVQGPQKQTQGRVSMRLIQGGPVNFEYAVWDQKIRLDLRKSPGSPAPNMAVIIDWQRDRVTLLYPDQKAYSEMRLSQFRGTATAILNQWRLLKQGPVDTISGRQCEIWELSNGTQRASICLLSGPLELDVTGFEKAMGLNLPDWAERMLAQGYLPLRIKLSTTGKSVYQQEVSDWTFSNVSPDDFRIPNGYHRFGSTVSSAGGRKRGAGT